MINYRPFLVVGAAVAVGVVAVGAVGVVAGGVLGPRGEGAVVGLLEIGF